MKEIWKDIEGYKGKYMVSNLGRVKSLNYNKTGKERILKARDNGRGYLFVSLWKDAKGKHYLVHRLVATAFCENPSGYKEINHINEDKSDNRADNLEFCSHSYNNSYNDKAKKVGEKLKGKKLSEVHKKKIAEKQRNDPKKSKPVFSVDKVTGEIKEFPSLMEASRQTGINHSHVSACCKGKEKSAGGYYWHYVESEGVM